MCPCDETNVCLSSAHLEISPDWQAIKMQPQLYLLSQSLCRGVVKHQLITCRHVFVCMEVCHEVGGDTYLCMWVYTYVSSDSGIQKSPVLQNHSVPSFCYGSECLRYWFGFLQNLTHTASSILKAHFQAHELPHHHDHLYHVFSCRWRQLCFDPWRIYCIIFDSGPSAGARHGGLSVHADQLQGSLNILQKKTMPCTATCTSPHAEQIQSTSEDDLIDSVR